MIAMMFESAGNQSPDPLIVFRRRSNSNKLGWESVTRPLDRLLNYFDAALA